LQAAAQQVQLDLPSPATHPHSHAQARGAALQATLSSKTEPASKAKGFALTLEDIMLDEEEKRFKKQREKELKQMMVDAGTHLCHSAGKGDTKKIKELIEFGASADDVNPKGWVPLKVACEHQQRQAVTALLEAKANVNLVSITTSGLGLTVTALHVAARVGNKAVCELLINGGADSTISNSRQQLAHEVASEYGNLHVARYLQEQVAKQVVK